MCLRFCDQSGWKQCFWIYGTKVRKIKNNSENQVEAATTQAKKKTKKANAGDIDLSKIKDGTYEGQANGYRGLVKVSVTVKIIRSQRSKY